ncbi:MAG TPA: hypothetical protein VF097_03120 [Actinomycetota bacterium]
MQGHTIWELSRMHAADLLLDAGPVRRRPRRRMVRRAVGTGMVRAGYRLIGARAS